MFAAEAQGHVVALVSLLHPEAMAAFKQGFLMIDSLSEYARTVDPQYAGASRRTILQAAFQVKDRAEFLASLGLEDSGLDRIIRAGYALLGLITYFTVGPKEARAWTILKGMKAPQAAGVIHGDFERGFIAAETVAYDDYVALGGEQGAKEAGKMRVEGKEYVVKDGDVMLFRFNV